MGCPRIWDVVLTMFLCLCSSCVFQNVQGSNFYNGDSLNSFVYDYAFKKMSRSHTGTLYNFSLPSNFSGVKVSILRIRTRSLWIKGANISFFNIPPRILPWPFSKRIDLVFQNLGNMSSLYYNLSDYTFVVPVVGILAYDSSTVTPHDEVIELNLMGDEPIVVRFPNVSSTTLGMKCVRFSTNGSVEFTNLTRVNSCVARGQGHFSIVVPYRPSDEAKGRVWKWWVIGFAGGIVGLILILVVVIMGYKLVKGRRMKKMVKQSERSDVLGTIWIGRSKMPSASVIRTQPELESSYVP